MVQLKPLGKDSRSENMKDFLDTRRKFFSTYIQNKTKTIAVKHVHKLYVLYRL